jgi:hypothetical protein
MNLILKINILSLLNLGLRFKGLLSFMNNVFLGGFYEISNE